MNVPFTLGVAPSFHVWVASGSSGKVGFEEGCLLGVAAKAGMSKFDGKGFYQKITGQGAFIGGVSRRFLGLTPGHSYRVRARMNTLETKTNDWGLTFIASPGAPSGEELSSDQLAGLVKLPNDSGSLIAKFDAAKHTEGKWVECASGPGKDGTSTTDIFLPLGGGTAITVWFRFEGKNMPDCAVGLDSVSIEDMGEKK